jgi:ribosomal protein S18 acetylase RimI-like enzyme
VVVSPVLRRSAPLVLEPTSGGRRRIPARAHPWPGEPTAAQLIVLDPVAVPTPDHFRDWAEQLAMQGVRTLRTGALAPRQAAQAEAAGLSCIQELALLEAREPYRLPRPAVGDLPRVAALGTGRFGRDELAAAAEVDRAAFGDMWQLDGSMLADVCSATPAFRARGVFGERSGAARRPLVGFLLSGRAGDTGYVQRLAVHPEARRRHVATALVQDSLRWMQRRGAGRAFVNTHVENDAALGLYHRHGFVDLPERLRVYEGSTRP